MSTPLPTTHAPQKSTQHVCNSSESLDVIHLRVWGLQTRWLGLCLSYRISSTRPQHTHIHQSALPVILLSSLCVSFQHFIQTFVFSLHVFFMLSSSIIHDQELCMKHTFVENNVSFVITPVSFTAPHDRICSVVRTTSFHV